MPATKNVNQQQVQYIPSKNQLLMGKKGPLACKISMDFSATTQYKLNLQQQQSTNNFDFCQTIFIDNSKGGDTLTVTIGGSGQQIVAKAATQGYYNVICPNPIELVFDSNGGALATVFLINVAIPGHVWPVS